MVYQFSRATVLVVDDMKPMLGLTVQILKTFGFEKVYQTEDPETALDLYRTHSPDLIITDWHMEPIDGIEMVKRIRKEQRSPNRYVPVIMMSGYSHRFRVEEARDAGITEFLVKPFRAKDLYRRVEQIVERPRKFVETSSGFFGPDRRRKKNDEYEGPRRRENDEFREIDDMENADAERLLVDLKDQARSAAKEDE